MAARRTEVPDTEVATVDLSLSVLDLPLVDSGATATRGLRTHLILHLAVLQRSGLATNTGPWRPSRP